MRIGIDCFQDLQLQSIIRSENQKGHCDIQNKDDVLVYDTDKNENNDLQANIISIIDLYVPEKEIGNKGRQTFGRIENKLSQDWRIFSNNLTAGDIRQIVLAVCRDQYTGKELIFHDSVGLAVLSDVQFLRDHCLTGEETWAKFSSDLKHELRFHKHLNLNVLQQLFESETLHLKLNQGEKLYRSRISSNGKMYPKDQMGAPPADKASEGRVNSKGIPCLYLANSMQTTLHEIRARDFDEVTVATFTPIKTVTLIDLRKLNHLSPFAAGIGLDWFAVNVEILLQISRDIAKPMRRNDSVLDYLPSQYIADFIKSLGYDGICFFSTLNGLEHGVNYAFFDERKFRCTNVKLVRVKNLEFHTEDIGVVE